MSPDFIQWRTSLLSATNLSLYVKFTLTKHGARTVKLCTWRILNVPTKSVRAIPACQEIHSFIHSFSILSDDRSKASSKMMPPYSAMHSLLLQMRISSPVLYKHKYKNVS